MPNLLHLSERAALALHAMVILADGTRSQLNTHQIVETLPAPEQHTAEVLQRLAKAQLVHPVAGSDGGFRLAKPARETSLLEIWEATEGPQSDEACCCNEPSSDGIERLLDDILRPLRNRLYDYLATTTLAELAQGALLPTPDSRADATAARKSW